jgi:branched-chain amino acid transport system ATP-binding protein
MTADIVLNVTGASKRFGGVQALSDVGITIRRGEVVGLIGPNGAGKTTFFNVITGLYTPGRGRSSRGGKPPPKPVRARWQGRHQRARVPEHSSVSRMTAIENVMVGRHVRTGSG